MESHGSGAQVTVSFFFFDTINYSKTSIARSFITPLPIFKRIHSLGWLPLLHSFQTLSLTHSHSSILSNTPLLVPPPLVSTILQTPSVHEMLSLPCTLPLLSILILIIHSAMPLPLPLAPTPSPTSSSSSDDMAVVQTQAQALIAFKDAITNDPSSCLSSWTTTTTSSSSNTTATPSYCSAWYGLHCDERFHITSLNLSFCFLSGSIPPSLALLPYLSLLDLSFNNFSGPIPSSLGNLTHLRYLDLSYNKLTGKIPATFGSCSQLTYLQLGFNSLRGSIPSELGMLINLQELFLFTNSLEGIVPVDALHNLTRLQVLHLYQNNLIGKIESLNLSKLPNLESFSVYGNALEGGLPAGLTESEALVIFDVQRNKYLTGSLGNSATPHITGLSKLRVLSVSYNQLSGDIPGWVWKLPRLQALDLSNNRFSGSFPATLTHLFYFKLNQTTLYQTEFYDGHTTLYEDVPVTIKNTVFTLNYVLSTRINFDVSMNDLEGKIPESFGELLGLTGANLSHNRISGTIPAGTFGRLMQLDELDLSYNKLSGGIPQDLTSLGSLSTLNLAHNQLEGPIPTQNNFDTRFTSASFENNPGLYGCPLSSCNTSYSNASSSDVGSRSTGGQRQQRLLIVVWFHEFVSQWGLLVGYPAGLVLGIFLCRPLSLKLK